MNSVYLNDLSMNSSDSIAANWKKVILFGSVIEGLRDWGVTKVEVPEDFHTLKLCDMEFYSCYDTENSFLSREKKLYLQSLSQSFHKCKSLRDNCSFEVQNVGKSQLLGDCCLKMFPVVSFTFNEVFAKNDIDGILCSDAKSTSFVLDNIYKPFFDGEVPFMLFKKECYRYKPLDNPMWNVEYAKKYRESLNFNSDYISKHPEEKIALLLKIGDGIAKLNGWIEAKRLSDLNSDRTHIRRIFYSGGFSDTDCYLSIDLEKTDVFYELLDKRGKHVCEIKWDGSERNQDSTGKHDIKLRK